MCDSNPPRSRAVHFSQFSDMVIIPRDNVKSKAYSHNDRRRFQQDMISDARRMSRLLTITPGEEITQDDIYGCIDIELYLSRGLAMYAQERKRAHSDSIISHQTSVNKQALAMLSENSSRWARDRAVNSAAATFRLH